MQSNAKITVSVDGLKPRKTTWGELLAANPHWPEATRINTANDLNRSGVYSYEANDSVFTIRYVQPTARQLQKQADELNGVIHSRNLYLAQNAAANRRCINAHVATDTGGKFLAVQDLYSNALYPVADFQWIDGYGAEVCI